MCAEFDTRCRQDYASVSEILPGERAARDAAEQPGEVVLDPAVLEAFAASRERFLQTLGWLSGQAAGALEHGELEDCLESRGRELVRQLF